MHFWAAGPVHFSTDVYKKDTADTNATLYKCFFNTKLQLYDRIKHKLIVDLFKELFDAERFIRSFGL